MKLHWQSQEAFKDVLRRNFQMLTFSGESVETFFSHHVWAKGLLCKVSNENRFSSKHSMDKEVL